MARRPPPRPASAPPPSPRELLLSTWYGRLFIAAAVVKFVVALWRVTAALPAAARVGSSAATIGLAVALFMFAWRLFTQIKRRLLWRVRRKLILSYIFIGVIPSLLILVFFLFAGSLLFMNLSAYLFKDGYDSIVEGARRAPRDPPHPRRARETHPPRLPHSPADVQGDLDRLSRTRRQPRDRR